MPQRLIVFLTLIAGLAAYTWATSGNDDAKKTSQRSQSATSQRSFKTEERTYKRPSQAEIRKRLTPLQYRVTQQEDTEEPFNNEYWDNKRAGIYVDVVSGEPLFSSLDKFRSGTGWPSFTRPIDKKYIVEKTDYKLFWPRTELVSKIGKSHLGHVFDDGPRPTGKRYCINSAALRFIPRSQLEKQGYGEYEERFRRSDDKKSTKD